MDNTLITQDRLDELVRLCKLTPNTILSKDSIIVEVGVYKGGSLKLLGENFPKKLVYGIDTFEGLPIEDWNENEIHKVGDFSDNSYEKVEEFLGDLIVGKTKKGNIWLIKGYFPESFLKIIENDKEEYKERHTVEQYSFIHVDTDFYKSVKSCIEFFYPKLLKGGIMVFDDYNWPNCPGVKKALDESGLKYEKTNAKYQAYLIKE
jgi:hypothetical protein